VTARGAVPALLALALALPPLAAQGPAPVQAFELPSGLRCLLLENHERPLIRMDLVTRWERSELPAGKEGLGGFLGMAMAAGGAGPYSRPDFNRALDGLGMTFTFKAELGAFRWTATADSRSQESAMELLADAVVRPALDGPLVESQRQLRIKQVGVKTPQEAAIDRFAWNLGDPAVLLPPAKAALDRLELQDLLDLRRRVVRPEASTLALYGDLNLAQAKQLVLMHLGIWGPGGQPPLPGGAGRTAALPGPGARLLAPLGPRPGAELWAGAAPPASGTGPGVEALLPILLARTAGSFFGTCAMAFQLPGGGRSPLLIKAKLPQGQRDDLVPSLVAGLAGLRRSGFSAEDLASALIQWKAENAALALHPEQLLRALLDGRLDPALARAVDAVTVKDLAEALKAWLEPERLRFLLLGGDATLVQAAEKAGLGPAQILGAED